MKKKLFILKITGWLLLLVFGMTIIPKNVLHDVLADHHDVPSCEHPYKSTAHLHQKQTDCKFDLLAGKVPFLYYHHPETIFLDFIEKAKNISLLTISLQARFIQKESRGPPAV